MTAQAIARQTSRLALVALALTLPLACEKHEAGEKVSLPTKPAATASASAEAVQTAGETPAAAPAAAEPAAAAAAASPAPKITAETAQPQAPALNASGEQSQTRLTGQVTSVRVSKLAFKVAGFIGTTLAKPGTRAKKGDVLATLEPEDFDLKVQLTKARRDQAKVALDTSKKDLDREQQLQKENASTSAVLEKAQATFDNARLALKLAELDLTQNERNLNDTKLRAPYDCIVSEQMKFDGENLQSGNVVYEIVDMTSPEITFEAPERLIGKVAVGDRLNVTIPSSGFDGEAEVVRMVPVIAERTRTFRIITKLAKDNAGVTPGTFAEAKLN